MYISELLMDNKKNVIYGSSSPCKKYECLKCSLFDRRKLRDS